MNELVAYIDESGNTGDVAGDEPFADQPTFALVALVEPAGSGAASSVLSEVRAKHRLQGAEIKSRSVRARPQVVTDLLAGLTRAGVTPFVELMDKRYFLANNIVTYVLGHEWVDMRSPLALELANDLAEVVANELGDAPLRAYARLAKTPDDASCAAFLEALRHSVVTALVAARHGSRERLEVLGFAEAASARALELAREPGFAVERFLQEPDETVQRHRLGLLPYVQAIWNLCGRLNFFSRHAEKVRVLHDEQKEFAHVLKDYFQRLVSNRYREKLLTFAANERAYVDWDFQPGKFDLRFVDSTSEMGVQAADLVGGFCVRRMNDVIRGAEMNGRFDGVARMLGAVSPPGGINFVTTRRDVPRFLLPSRGSVS